MKIFVSWSGKRSKKLADVVVDWLDSVVPLASPFISSEIRKGEQWPARLREELAETRFVILCLTPENQEEPWINFEVGVASRQLNDNNLISPILLGMGPGDVKWPLAMFQNTQAESVDDMLRLARSVNVAVEKPREADKLKKVFDREWADFFSKVVEARKIPTGKVKAEARDTADIARETLELVREQNQLLTKISENLTTRTRSIDVSSWLPGSNVITSGQPFVRSLTDSGYTIDNLINRAGKVSVSEVARAGSQPNDLIVALDETKVITPKEKARTRKPKVKSRKRNR